MCIRFSGPHLAKLTKTCIAQLADYNVLPDLPRRFQQIDGGNPVLYVETTETRLGDPCASGHYFGWDAFEYVMRGRKYDVPGAFKAYHSSICCPLYEC